MLDSVTVRPILPDELDVVAYVRSIGFGGAEEAALAQLKSDPRYDFSHIILAEYKAEAIGVATIFPVKMWLSGVPVNTGAVMGLTVLPQFRRQGVAARIMEFGIVRMLAEGYALSVLFPYSHKYYRQFGYGTAGDLHVYQITPNNLFVFPEGHKVRPFKPDDLPMMRVMYKGQLTWRNGWFTRSNEWWDKIIERWSDIMVYDNEGMIEGYYAYELKTNDKGQQVIHIKEFFAAQDEAYRGLIGYLAAQNEAEVISYLAPPDTPLRHSMREPKASNAKNHSWIFDDMCHVTAGPMARIINLRAALTARFYSRQMSGERIIKVSDPSIPTNEVSLSFRLVDGRAEVRSAADDQPQLETDIGALSQVLCGYLTAFDARRLGRLQADEDTCSWLDRAIVDSPLYIQAGDWF